jgi:hypothetical protein
VSDQFKQVARRLVQQYLGDKLESACTSDRPLCRAFITGLVEAFTAATRGDDKGVQSALNRFFFDSAIAGGVGLFLDDITQLDKLSPDTPEHKTLRAITQSLVACAIDILRDQRAGACTFDKATGQALTTLHLLDPEDADYDILRSFADDVALERPPAPGVVIHTLAAVASSSLLDRHDIRMYLLSLEDAVSKGLEGGLFRMVKNLLASRPTQIDDLRKGKSIALLHPGDDEQYRRSLKECGLPLSAFESWVKERDSFAKRLRGYLLSAAPIPKSDLDLLDGLTRYRCSDHGKSAEGAVRRLTRQARYFRGALTAYQTRTRYGTRLLVSAAVLDLVRSSNVATLEAQTAEILATWLVSTSRRQCDWQAIEEATSAERVTEVQGTCESVLGAALILGETLAEVPWPCYDAEQKVLCGDVTVDNAAAQAACHFPAYAALKLPPSERRLGSAAIQSLTEGLEKLTEAAGGSLSGEEHQEAERVLRALRFWGSGDRAAARKVITRLAIETLLEHVKPLAERQFGISAKACEDDLHTTSVFAPLGAGCAAMVLVESAYYPIADYLWEGGVGAENANQVTASAYRSMLDSKLLAGSPLIVNVGLGATAVWGNDDIWGKQPYGALTVVDKLGLALYRRRGDSLTFEIGPFVGGFLDALVRTIADQEHKFWLAGGTVGFARIAGSQFGLALHAAAALPFTFNADVKDRIGFATGAALTIPWDSYFDKEK